MNGIVPVRGGQLQGATAGLPEILVRDGAKAVFAAEEFFKATVNNAHIKRAYTRAIARFLAWCERFGLELREIRPGLAGARDAEFCREDFDLRVRQRKHPIRRNSR